MERLQRRRGVERLADSHPAITAVEPLLWDCTFSSSSSILSTPVNTLSMTLVQLPTVLGFVSISSNDERSFSITLSLTN